MSLVSKKVNHLKWMAFLKSIEKAPFGSLNFTFPDGQKKFFKGGKDGKAAEMKIHDESCIDSFISHGDIGLGETYMMGMWETPSLQDLLIYFVENQKAIENFFHGKKMTQVVLSLQKLFKKNNRKRSKQNIEEHYDLGNDFYEIWLDPSMTYSSALFKGEDISLQQAQDQKYNRILDQFSNQPKTILEIGCGWGGFLEIAGKRGISLDALTLSPSQAHYAEQRSLKQGIENNVNVIIRDYRDVTQKYDSIVSIEMMEAVGAQYWSSYFSSIKKALKEKGKAVIQTITIDDDIFDSYLKRTDFIQKHIFPGGILPSKKVFKDLAIKNGFNVSDSFNFGLCYAKTLELWLKNFDKNYKKIREIGFDDAFIRKWRFYLAYCIAGFSTQQTDVFQFTLEHRLSA